MKAPREEITKHRRFELLYRDEFRCLFCGSDPGNDRLHIDHVIPVSKGGSDDPANLATACDRCNQGKKAAIYVPIRWRVDGRQDAHGWYTWRAWALWELRCSEAQAALILPSYPGELRPSTEIWIGLDRIHWDWDEWINGKAWAHYAHDYEPTRRSRYYAGRGSRATRVSDLATGEDLRAEAQYARRIEETRNEIWHDFHDALAFCRRLVRPQLRSV